MACVQLPALTEQELYAHLGGESSARVERHLAACPHCAARLEQLRREERAFGSLLYRAECPDSLVLGEFRLGLLARAERRAVAHHLADCPHCQIELADLDRLVADGDEPLEWGLVDHLRVIVARLIPPQGQLAAAPSAVRGGGQTSMLYEAEELQLSLESRGSREAEGRLLRGLVVGPAPLPAEAHLYRAGENVAVAPIDEHGTFRLDPLDPGLYELHLVDEQREIVVRGVEV